MSVPPHPSRLDRVRLLYDLLQDVHLYLGLLLWRLFPFFLPHEEEQVASEFRAFKVLPADFLLGCECDHTHKPECQPAEGR